MARTARTLVLLAPLVGLVLVLWLGFVPQDDGGGPPVGPPVPSPSLPSPGAPPGVEVGGADPSALVGAPRDGAPVLAGGVEAGPAERAAARELASGAAAEAPGPRRLAGRVVDARTGEPVPEFHLTLAHGRRHEELETDAEGRFRTRLRYPGGTQRLWLRDDAKPALFHGGRTVELPPPGEPWVLEVPVGPTFRLDLPPELAGARGALRAGLTPGGRLPGYDGGLGRAALRGGREPWVRLHPEGLPQGSAAEGATWTLWLRTQAGEFVGHGEVRRRWGVEPTPVAIRPSGGARLFGRVYELVDGARRPLPLERGRTRGLRDVPTGGVLELHGPDGPIARHLLVSDEFRFDHVPPGTYELRLDLEDRPTATTTVAVGLEDRTGLEVVVCPAPDWGTLRGIVREVEGVQGRRGLLVARAEDGSVQERAAFRTGEPFEVGPLPPGEYELAVESGRTVWALPVDEPVRVRVPATGVVLRAHSRPPGELELLWPRGSSAGGGLRVELRGGHASTVGLLERKRGGWIVTGVQAGMDLSWVAHARGLQLMRGRLSEAEGIGEGQYRWSPEKRSGWGGILWVRDASGKPCAGVPLRLDGHPVGATGANGRLDVSLDARPARITLDGDGWELLDEAGRPTAQVAVDGRRWDRVPVRVRRR